MSEAYVYVITSGQFQKIGFSNDPQNRLSALKTGSPFPLEVGFKLLCANADAVERRAHFALRFRRCNGEWFDVSFADAVEVVIAAKRLVEQNVIPFWRAQQDPNSQLVRILQRVQWEVAQRYDETGDLVLSPAVEGAMIDALHEYNARLWSSGVKSEALPFDDGWSPVAEVRGQMGFGGA
jgi:hypothetical protein